MLFAWSLVRIQPGALFLTDPWAMRRVYPGHVAPNRYNVPGGASQTLANVSAVCSARMS